MDLRRTKEAALLAYSYAHFAGLVAVTTVPSYETRLGTTVAGFGEDPSANGCTVIAPCIMSLAFSGLPLTATNIANVIDVFASPAIVSTRAAEDRQHGEEVSHLGALKALLDNGLLSTVRL